MIIKGDKKEPEDLKKEGWYQKDSMMGNYQIWINNFIGRYLYYDPETKIIHEVISVV